MSNAYEVALLQELTTHALLCILLLTGPFLLVHFLFLLLQSHLARFVGLLTWSMIVSVTTTALMVLEEMRRLERLQDAYSFAEGFLTLAWLAYNFMAASDQRLVLSLWFSAAYVLVGRPRFQLPAKESQSELTPSYVGATLKKAYGNYPWLRHAAIYASGHLILFLLSLLVVSPSWRHLGLSVLTLLIGFPVALSLLILQRTLFSLVFHEKRCRIVNSPDDESAGLVLWRGLQTRLPMPLFFASHDLFAVAMYDPMRRARLFRDFVDDIDNQQNLGPEQVVAVLMVREVGHLLRYVHERLSKDLQKLNRTRQGLAPVSTNLRNDDGGAVNSGRPEDNESIFLHHHRPSAPPRPKREPPAFLRIDKPPPLMTSPRQDQRRRSLLDVLVQQATCLLLEYRLRSHISQWEQTLEYLVLGIGALVVAGACSSPALSSPHGNHAADQSGSSSLGEDIHGQLPTTLPELLSELDRLQPALEDLLAALSSSSHQKYTRQLMTCETVIKRLQSDVLRSKSAILEAYPDLAYNNED
jgi:hypothetical protein